MGNKSLYYLTCVLFYIVAIINFFNSDTTTGAVWLLYCYVTTPASSSLGLSIAQP